MSSPVNKRSTSGTRRFNPLKALQPKWRLQQILSSPSASPPFDYCRFIELDYTPMEAGIMVSMRQSRGFVTPKSPERHCRRSPAPVSNRDPYGNASLSSSSNSGSCKGSDCSPTPRRHMKYTSCTDNHGIKPPPPEQYLTPLQQKEVCIRHLRARLKETVERLQDRDTEIDELRTHLSRMQEDWIEEECHRVEAQLALKEARREIQQLKQVIDVVRSSLGEADSGVQKCFQDINVQNHKLDTLLQSMELAQAGVAKVTEAPNGGGAVGAGPWVGEGSVGSCEGSPAHSVTRSSTYTKLSEVAQPERNESGSGSDVACCLSAEGTQDSGFVCCGEMEGAGATRAELLLEAACLSEETASLLNACSRLPHSATYEALCCGEPRMLPMRCSLGRTAGREAALSISNPCLSHHHLYLHHLREQAIQTECDSGPASAPVHGAAFGSDLDTIAEVRTFRSQACSPTSTWLSDEGDDLDSVTSESVVTATAGGKAVFTETQVSTEPALALGATEAVVTMAVVDDSLSLLPTAKAMPATDAAQNPSAQDTSPRPDYTSCPVPEMPLVENPTPQTTQPQRVDSETNISGVTVVEVNEDIEESQEEGAASTTSSGCGVPVKSYWSRHFLVDLLAVAVPVVPTVAWLCRGPRREGQPMYHIGALLRGCCTVALHSLRRGGGLRHYPAGGGGPGGINI
ncbi:syntaphilin isoform X1 [Tachysurus fulvidraco]|uniref:syntaphilin isoform X1 n=3 Tax=Tachysurus fulvidraco TaxID=1234273 RepID=UPI000F4F880C|nr:syntaphilin isoform X1 [Tachysurus fulvidraco]XP_027000591.1 syntaphilin isoform X1 [Tachysurus fulvidraco]